MGAKRLHSASLRAAEWIRIAHTEPQSKSFRLSFLIAIRRRDAPIPVRRSLMMFFQINLGAFAQLVLAYLAKEVRGRWMSP